MDRCAPYLWAIVIQKFFQTNFFKISLKGNITEFIGSKIKCLPSDKMDDPFIHVKDVNLNCEMSEFMQTEKVMIEVPNDHSTTIKWSPRIHILIHESITEIFSNIKMVISPPPTPSGPRNSGSKTSGFSDKMKYCTAALRNIYFNFMLDNGKLLTIGFNELCLNLNKNVVNMSCFTVCKVNIHYNFN